MTNPEEIYFVYDGACPICAYAAQALRIKQAVGTLHLINARTDRDHPVYQEVNNRKLNLDEGMVIFYQNRFYHGQDALHLMALLGGETGWFNKVNALLFRSETIAKLCYPTMRGIRNLLLKLKRVDKICNLTDHNAPLFKSIFGDDWEKLPPVMKKHYANRAFHDDIGVVEGVMKIESSWLGKLMAPFLKLAGTLVPYEGDNISATVRFVTTRDSNVFQFDRTFFFPDKKPYRFLSRMVPQGGNELIEFMGFGLGWRCAFSWNGEKVILAHRGYVVRMGGFNIPLPLGLLLGTGDADETPIDDTTFAMRMDIRHPLWGKVYGYSGTFKVTQEVAP